MSDTEFPCPSCDRSFSTDRGRSIHHTKVHGSSIGGVSVACRQCGAELTRKRCVVEEQDNSFCGSDCYGEYLSENRSGEDHPQYAGGTVQNECEWCGTTYAVTPSRQERRRFCGEGCFKEWIRSGNAVSGEEHPSYNSSSVECAHCSDTVLAPRYRVELYENIFCDSKCRKEFQEDHPPHGCYIKCTCQTCGQTEKVRSSLADGRKYCSLSCRDEGISGPDSVHWKGGKRLYRLLRSHLPKSWSSQSSAVRRRDGYSCQMCGETAEETVQNLPVHHIVPILSGGCNASELLITLCHSCHRRAEKYISDYVTEPYTDWTQDELPDGRMSSTEYLTQCQADNSPETTAD